MTQGVVRLHVPSHMLPDGPEELPSFYKRLLDGLSEIGAKTVVVERDYAHLRRGPHGADFDFVHNGNVDRKQVLNLGPAYLGRFFYADPKGIFFESSLADLTFRPKAIPADRAAEFAALLRQQWIAGRKSRHVQPDEVTAFSRGHIAIFLQDWSDPVARSRHMDGLQMVETVLSNTFGRKVVVKPHPRNIGVETTEICEYLSHRHPEVVITQANVHDILAGAVATVSISSSVAMEGMLHGVPAILFGRSDMHHCAETVQRPADWPAAFDRALTRDWPFERFLFWFLKRQSIWASRPFLHRILERMQAQGADFPALGITPPP